MGRPTGGITGASDMPRDAPHDIGRDVHQEKIIEKFYLTTNKYYICVPPRI